MPNPIESVVAMFLMSMNAFSDYYVAFEKTNHETVAKVNYYSLFKLIINCQLLIYYFFIILLAVLFRYIYGYCCYITS